ncbi:helix-turn-helix domain-containing protein [Streptomyces sp. NPDC002853]
MRYAQGGGLGPSQQAARERIGMLAGAGFARGEKNADIARELRVSLRSVERWRRAWRKQGLDALHFRSGQASQGFGGGIRGARGGVAEGHGAPWLAG